ncbi:MAG: OmpH family outer membrane protein [Alphaproteobacteria bacterium]
MSLMRANIAPLVAIFLVSVAFGHAQAQQASSSPAAPPALNVLVVDVQSLLQNSKSAKMVRQQIEQKRSEYAKEISQQEEGLRRERDALQRQQASLSADALNKKGREFQQKVNELDHSVQAKRQTLEKSNAEALESIQSVILKIITEIAKDKKANLVFQRSELVLFDNSFDVTDQVLSKLDEQLPTLTVSFAAETPSASTNAKTDTEAPPAKPQSKKKQ